MTHQALLSRVRLDVHALGITSNVTRSDGASLPALTEQSFSFALDFPVISICLIVRHT